MKDLLVICFPTFGQKNEIHYNRKGDRIVLAPSEFIRILSEGGIDLDVVSITDDTLNVPLLDCEIVPKPISEVDVNGYKFIWHMFRDPTQPEVLEKMSRVSVTSNPIYINDIAYVKDFYKDVYYKSLAKFDLAPKVFNDINYLDVTWDYHNYGTSLSKDKKLICSSSYNNNRGDYIDREKRKKMVVEYIDNTDSEGKRSFFRFGYAFDKISIGWLYRGDEYSLKSGNCKIKIPYHVPEKFHERIRLAMNDMKIDVCHVEGLLKDDKLYIFDINPYPTASGNTLSAITEEISKSIIERIKS